METALIVVFGMALAALQPEGVPVQLVALWPNLVRSWPTVASTTRESLPVVGDLHVGEGGWVDPAAVRRLDDARLIVNRSAVVRPHPAAGWVGVRRGHSGWEVAATGDVTAVTHRPTVGWIPAREVR